MVQRTDQRVWLERQADRIERTLSGLQLPVRVSGGRVSEGRVRYHITPVGYTRAEQIEAAQADVAAALGAPRIRVARERDGLALEVESQGVEPVRLLPLMHALGDPDPLTAVLGMAEDGRPLSLKLGAAGSEQLWIAGDAGVGKSELLRTVALSLALASRPAQMQLLGIDPSGRELTVLEGLPHTLAELARDPEAALDLTGWLEQEVDRRRRLAIDRPALVLLVDDLQRLRGPAGVRVPARLARIGRRGGQFGVHLFVAHEPGTASGVDAPADAAGMARARPAGGVGRFRFEAGAEVVTAQVAWLPARDLATAVALASARPGSLDAGGALRGAGGSV